MKAAKKPSKTTTATKGASPKKPFIRPSALKIGDVDTGVDDWMKVKTLLKPDDQLDVPEAELKEEVARFLISVDPQAPKNVVEYSFKHGSYVPVRPAPPTVTLVHLEGCAILKDSPEAQEQIAAGDWAGDEEIVKKEKSKKEDEEEEETGRAAGTEEGEEVTDTGAGGDEGEGEPGELVIEAPSEVPAAVASAPAKRKKKLLNAFNFCERAALTYNNPNRDMSTQTTPLPRSVFSGLVSGWMIYDFYAEDFERQQKEKEKEKKQLPPIGGAQKKELDKKKLEQMATEAVQLKTYEAALILDRMICQNLFDDVSQDYRYYEDPSDDYRQEEGTLLPLWKFCYEKTKKNTVTEIQWNPQYYDLFAVTFGSYDFTKQPSPGAICLFTLKNPSFPEYIRHTDVSLMSVSIHKKQAYLLAVGMYDGNVAVYNTNTADKRPQLQSNPVTNKHLGCVWQVRWGEDLQDGELNIFSISCDGKVNNWVLMENELVVTTIISLTLPIETVAGPDGAFVKIAACGSSITFHPTQKAIYLVGTEEGKIFKCSTLYSSKYLFTYEAHTMPVHKLSYNRFYPHIFLSCSGDWTVKIWQDMRSSPLFAFDLLCSVSDAQWAPYSSSVFAAVTVDGKCHVFDLNINKYKAICTQNVVSRKGKNRISKLRFNYNMPIIVVGDERGTITTLKLSPMLRMKPKAPKKKEVPLEPRELEIMKLEKILSLVVEPEVLQHPPDVESVKVY